jgi:hypothetical protein
MLHMFGFADRWNADFGMLDSAPVYFVRPPRNVTIV